VAVPVQERLGAEATNERRDGSFDAEARAAATNGCLPLLATYFVRGEAWTLVPQAALSSGEQVLDRDLAAAIRLRVLLALAAECERVLQQVVEHASFRYGRRFDESVGVVAGRLDVPSYVRSRAQIVAPRRYPVRIVERQLATPENVLAAAALHALLDALGLVPAAVIPHTGPERRALDERRAALTRMSQLPLLRLLGPPARDLARRGRLARQRDVVMRRLDRRDIANPEPYAALAHWVSRYLESAVPSAGDVAWAFYDERFDSKLFEIWSLNALAVALTRRFGPPVEGELRPLWLRDDAARATWQTTYGEIEVHFQRDARSLGLKGRWGITARGHVLGAVPDITVRMRSGTGETTWFLLDCKLRRRRPLPADDAGSLDLPVEEIYKTLGYFEHLAPGPPSVAALVYYTPGACRSSLLERPSGGDPPSGGTLLLSGVDPAVADVGAVFDAIVDVIGRQVGEPPESVRREADELAKRVTESGGDELEAAAASKARLFEEVVSAWAERHPAQRETVESTTRAAFRADDWDALDADTRRMLVSAEAYAVHQNEGIDYSGPLLVLCAACERELNRRFFMPLVRAREEAGSPPLVPEHPTLGQALFYLRSGLTIAVATQKRQTAKVEKQTASAATSDEADAWTAVADYLLEHSYDLAAVTKLLERLSALNKRYRRVAAHDATAGRETWVLGRGLVLGPDQVVHDTLAALTPSQPAEG
jgi:hypothetical protein